MEMVTGRDRKTRTTVTASRNKWVSAFQSSRHFLPSLQWIWLLEPFLAAVMALALGWTAQEAKCKQMGAASPLTNRTTCILGSNFLALLSLAMPLVKAIVTSWWSGCFNSARTGPSSLNEVLNQGHMHRFIIAQTPRKIAIELLSCKIHIVANPQPYF